MPRPVVAIIPHLTDDGAPDVFITSTITDATHLTPAVLIAGGHAALAEIADSSDLETIRAVCHMRDAEQHSLAACHRPAPMAWRIRSRVSSEAPWRTRDPRRQFVLHCPFRYSMTR